MNKNTWRFQYPISIMNRTAKDKFHKKTEDVNNIINQLQLTSIYGMLSPKTAQYTFLVHKGCCPK